MSKNKKWVEERHIYHHVEVDGGLLAVVAIVLAILVFGEKILRILL